MKISKDTLQTSPSDVGSGKLTSHRKSKPMPRDWASGNEAKYLSYREAWARIKLATKQKFYLEAVTIEESIISDRLLSYLVKTCKFEIDDKFSRGPLHSIAQKWRKESTALISESDDAVKEVDDLFSRLNTWRDLRNRVVHGIVKSKVSRLDDHIDDFLAGAASAAVEGEKIARAIDRWVARHKS